MKSSSDPKSIPDHYKNLKYVSIYKTPINAVCTDVYKSGVYDGEEKLLIKKLALDVSIENSLKAIEIMEALTTSSASNIVKLYGYFTNDCDQYSILTTYAQEGSLYDWLEYKGYNPDCPADYDPFHPQLRPQQQMQIIKGIAAGLVQMHRADILYCNFTPKNILLDKFFKPMLSDFTQSVRIGEDNPKVESTDFQYLAPELLFCLSDPFLKGNYSKETDIYGFSILCWQILSDKKIAYPEVEDNITAMNGWVNDKKNRPAIPNCRTKLASFFKQTWAHEPKDRLSINNALKILYKIPTPIYDKETETKLSSVISFLTANYSFFASPFLDTNDDHPFQTWTESNKEALDSYYEDLNKLPHSKDQTEAFRIALMGLNEADLNCLRWGNEKLMREFLLDKANKGFIQFLKDHMYDPIIKKWEKDNNLNTPTTPRRI